MKSIKSFYRITANFVFIMLLSAPSFAGQGLTVSSGNGKIDWGQGVALGVSSIVPMEDSIDPSRTKALAVRQAGVQARRNLLNAVLDISIDNRSTVKDIIADDYKSSVDIRGYVQNSLLETKVAGNGEVEVTSSISLRKNIASVIYPSSVPFLSGIEPRLNLSTAIDSIETLSNFTSGNQTEDQLTTSSSYSGIIIDTRSMDIKPVLLPVIYGGDGIGIYGAFSVSRSNVLSKGLVGYFTDIKSDDVFERVGSNPLIVTPARIEGSANIVLSVKDGLELKAALENNVITSNCAVAVIVASSTSNTSVAGDGSDDALEQNEDNGSNYRSNSGKPVIVEEPLIPETKSGEKKLTGTETK